MEEKKKRSITRTMYGFAVYTASKKDPRENLDLRIRNMVRDQFDMVRLRTQYEIEDYIKEFIDLVLKDLAYIPGGCKNFFFNYTTSMYAGSYLDDIVNRYHL